jgi:hypothetical protein
METLNVRCNDLKEWKWVGWKVAAKRSPWKEKKRRESKEKDKSARQSLSGGNIYTEWRGSTS